MITPEDRVDIDFLLGEVADLSCKQAAADLATRILMDLPDEVTVEAVINVVANMDAKFVDEIRKHLNRWHALNV